MKRESERERMHSSCMRKRKTNRAKSERGEERVVCCFAPGCEDVRPLSLMGSYWFLLCVEACWNNLSCPVPRINLVSRFYITSYRISSISISLPLWDFIGILSHLKISLNNRWYIDARTWINFYTSYSLWDSRAATVPNRHDWQCLDSPLETNPCTATNIEK